MPRKFFRRYLPSHESVRNHRYISRLGPRLHEANLWCLNRRSVAGGVSAGLFAGLIPGSNPVQFLAAALLSVGFRVNLPLAVVVTLYSNPFTIVPLYYVAFKLGQIVLMQSGGAVPNVREAFEGRAWQDWMPALFDWTISVGKPLLIGVPILAVVLAFAGYIVVDRIWKIYVTVAWHRRKRRRRTLAR
jgi:uncharacterized protein